MDSGGPEPGKKKKMASASLLTKRLNDYRIAIPPCSVSPAGLRSHIDSGSLIGCLPENEEFLTAGCLYKLNLEREWVSQRISVSRSTLYMTSPENKDVKDLIPLHEVLAVASLSGRNTAGVEEDEWRKIIAGEVGEIHPFELKTESSGYNSGRAYIFAASSETVRDEWVRCLASAAKESRLLAAGRRDSKIKKVRRRVKKLYDSRPFLYLTAFLILGNFFSNVLQAEKNPLPGSPEQTAFDDADLAFTG